MKLAKSERLELQRQARASNGRVDSARHARLILLLPDGLTWATIRAAVPCRQWLIWEALRRRFGPLKVSAQA
jgi:hypothetical protein